jgi:hypothetical protein
VPRRTLILLLALATMAFGAPLPARAQAPSGPTFEHTPASGETGTVIDVWGAGCAGDGVIVRLVGGGRAVAWATVPAEADGSWSGSLLVTPGAPVRTYRLEARCAYPGGRDLVVYESRSFVVTGSGAAPPGEITTPNFNGGIEPFAAYDGQSTCSPSPKPGTVAFANLLLNNFGGGNSGIGRPCNVGGTSEHKEGRAFDWANNAGSARDRSRVNAALHWLFATDVNCNAYANARRLGIMYVIWNRRMFRMYDADRGWAPYSGASPHTDHVHFSLTRAGGNKRTSYWTRTYRGPAGGNVVRRGAEEVGPNPPNDSPPLAGDFDGNGIDDLLWYDPAPGNDAVWFGTPSGAFAGRDITMNRAVEPFVGDFNGDCRSDIFWYGPGTADDVEWRGRRDRNFRPIDQTVNGDFDHPVVGDFNRDRYDDILWYGEGSAPDALWRGSAYGYVRSNTVANGNYQPLVGDFDGDRRDDILWYGAGTAPDQLWWSAGRAFRGRSVTVNHDAQPPVVGDYNGDQRDDILWYGPASAPDALWKGAADRVFRTQSITAGHAHTYGVAGDFTGNGRDDVYWHGAASADDLIWQY